MTPTGFFSALRSSGTALALLLCCSFTARAEVPPQVRFSAFQWSDSRPGAVVLQSAKDLERFDRELRRSFCREVEQLGPCPRDGSQYGALQAKLAGAEPPIVIDWRSQSLIVGGLGKRGDDGYFIRMDDIAIEDDHVVLSITELKAHGCNEALISPVPSYEASAWIIKKAPTNKARIRNHRLVSACPEQRHSAFAPSRN